MGRSRSSSSSSSSSDGSFKKNKKDKKDKKDKKKDHKDKNQDHKKDKNQSHAPEMKNFASTQHQIPLMPQVPGFPQAPGFPQTRDGHSPQPGHQAPTPQASSIPSSGYRVPLNTASAFPPQQQTGHPPFQDADGSPVFFGSALLEKSVHPCKIAPAQNPPCLVPYGGGEYHHNGRYDLLPFDGNTMEMVRASHGQLPAGKRPVEGGYEEDGAKLYHGVAVIQGVRVPGKTGPHLGGCNVSFGGGEHVITENYEVLCWRY